MSESTADFFQCRHDILIFATLPNLGAAIALQAKTLAALAATTMIHISRRRRLHDLRRRQLTSNFQKRPRYATHGHDDDGHTRRAHRIALWAKKRE